MDIDGNGSGTMPQFRVAVEAFHAQKVVAINVLLAMIIFIVDSFGGRFVPLTHACDKVPPYVHRASVPDSRPGSRQGQHHRSGTVLEAYRRCQWIPAPVSAPVAVPYNHVLLLGDPLLEYALHCTRKRMMCFAVVDLQKANFSMMKQVPDGMRSLQILSRHTDRSTLPLCRAMTQAPLQDIAGSTARRAQDAFRCKHWRQESLEARPVSGFVRLWTAVSSTATKG
jgi:hypothetical protein